MSNRLKARKMLNMTEISRVVEGVEEEHGVKVSEQAKKLIALTSEAMDEDPHPLWRFQPQFRQLTPGGDAMQQIQTEILEDQLAQLAESMTPRDLKEIGFFHVLHWLVEGEFFKGWPVPKDPV